MGLRDRFSSLELEDLSSNCTVTNFNTLVAGSSSDADSLHTHPAKVSGESDGERVEHGRETFTNSGTAAADVTVAVTFGTAFSSAPHVVLGKECTQDARVSVAATTTGFSITVASVPASTTVYVNWMAIGT